MLCARSARDLTPESWEPEDSPAGLSTQDGETPRPLLPLCSPRAEKELLSLFWEARSFVVKDRVKPGASVPSLKLCKRLRRQTTGLPLTPSPAVLVCWEEYEKEGTQEIILPRVLVVSDLILP